MRSGPPEAAKRATCSSVSSSVVLSDADMIKALSFTGTAAELRENTDVKEFYLGISEGGRVNFRNVKHYRRRKRWLT